MIRNLKVVCPQGHVLVAISYDDAKHTQAEAALHLGRGVGLITRGRPPICEVCGAINFTLDDEITDYRSLAEAMPALTEAAIREMQERRGLSSSADRN